MQFIVKNLSEEAENPNPQPLSFFCTFQSCGRTRGYSRNTTASAPLHHRHRARVRFGPPVDLSEFDPKSEGRAATRAATLKIYAAIQALAPKDDTEWTRAAL